MGGDEKRITLRIDVNSGTIELDAPVENFDQAIAKTKELTDSLDLGQRRRSVDGASKAQGSEQPKVEMNAATPERVRAKVSKPSSSAARAGRIGSFEPIRNLLTEDQQAALLEFVAQKVPKEQPDQVQVVLYQGEHLLGRQGFSFNEIYTLLWRAGIEDLPKALDVVVQKLMQEQKVDKGENGYYLKFIGRNYVEKELPAVAKGNS